MDIITDLTTRAVAYITVLQDIGNQELANVITDAKNKLKPRLAETITYQQQSTIADIIWSSDSTSSPAKKIELFFHFSEYLIGWLDEYNIDLAYKTPYQWRCKIRHILYTNNCSRLAMVNALHYIPLQIVIALIYKKDQTSVSEYDRRLFQVWLTEEHAEDHSIEVLEGDDRDKNFSWWAQIAEEASCDINNNTHKEIRRALAVKLLMNDHELLQRLTYVEAALPFESIFNEELNEISESRKKRFRNQPEQSQTEKEVIAGKNADPLERAQQMELYGLAFSGGGIRSATFNLGIIQKLAEDEENRILPRIDYLSTVSGGGYIGTWLASWIQRGGSVFKVADRLNHVKSADPMAEEVRPIRWLRMFSNYLAPDAGIMSTDSWTMGITWLRNTLINQVILFLMLLTVLSCLDIVFYLWSYLYNVKTTYTLTDFTLWGWNALILIPGGLLAGLGMQRHNKNILPKNKLLKWFCENLPGILVGWAFLAAFFVAARLITNYTDHDDYFKDLKYLIPTGVLGFLSMVMLAFVGRYQAFVPQNRDKVIFYVFISSLLSSLIGIALLAYLWKLFSCLIQLNDPCFVAHSYKLQCCGPVGRVSVPKDIRLSHFGLKLVYVIGIPLIMEIISCCVVVRMAIMGSLFPDERREWWGRVGAISHRAGLLWLIIISAVLLLPYAMQYIVNNINLIKLLGGWGVIVGAGLKLAYSSTASTDKKPGAVNKIVNIFTLIVPYIFMLGFLLLGAYALSFLSSACFRFQHKWFTSLDEKYIFLVPCIIITVILTCITLFLGRRVGVNEFSLHYFYRNRLIRAYLGATRSRTSRDKTVNKFTNFDNADDIKLKEFKTNNDYYGPLPILNTAINSTKNQELDRQDRKAESFIFTPLYCGFDFSLTRSAATAVDDVYEYGYRPTHQYAYTDGPSIGTAMAISGAAINPNWGYHSSPATAFLLTLFNVRLGWWIGNPRKNNWKKSDPAFGLLYLVKDLTAGADIDADYVCLSDGGHFDNMGLYELIRRRCSYIILGDGEEDDDSSFEGLANAMRRCRIDFGVEIKFEDEDFRKMIPQDIKNDVVDCTIMKGKIKYPKDEKDENEEKYGKLIYIKTRVTKKLTVDVRQYDMTHIDFPEQSTADQFFSEDQFESYRKLGYDSIEIADLEDEKFKFDFESCKRQNN